MGEEGAMPKKHSAAPRDFVGVSDALKHDHTDVPALFRRYLGSCSDMRIDLVHEILTRLQSHLEMEEGVLFEALRAAGPHSRDLVEGTILEHDVIQVMLHELLSGTVDEEDSWEERFEDMMQRVEVHFITEERDLLPLVDRSRDL